MSLLRHLWTDERGFIGTAAAIGIALGTAGASAAASIYGTKKAAGVNERAIAAQEAEGERALAFEREEALRREQARKEAMAVDQARWEDYLRANEPTWRAGGQVLTNLYDLAGMGGDGPAGPNIDALMTSGPQAAGVPEAGAPEGPLAVPRGGGRGAALFRATRAPIQMAMPQAGGGMKLQDLLALASMRRAPGAGLAPLDV